MNILETIAETKLKEVAALSQERGLDSLRSGALAQAPPKDFLASVNRPGMLSLIAELKKASPSKGVLRDPFDLPGLAQSYAQGGAQALSVLTDVEFFKGHLSYLAQAQKASGLPVLRKDFLIDPLQVYQSREAGADAILLIVAMLESTQLRDLQSLAWSLGMMVLVEVHDRKELEIALAVGVKLLGINNRDLRDFRVRLETTADLIQLCPRDLPVVSESGIRTPEDIRLIRKAGATAVLVGEAFMTSPDPGQAAKDLMSMTD